MTGTSACKKREGTKWPDVHGWVHQTLRDQGIDLYLGPTRRWCGLALERLRNATFSSEVGILRSCRRGAAAGPTTDAIRTTTMPASFSRAEMRKRSCGMWSFLRGRFLLWTGIYYFLQRGIVRENANQLLAWQGRVRARAYSFECGDWHGGHGQQGGDECAGSSGLHSRGSRDLLDRSGPYAAGTHQAGPQAEIRADPSDPRVLEITAGAG